MNAIEAGNYLRKSASIRGSSLSFRVHSRLIFVSIRG
jgi:hypothetical protein